MGRQTYRISRADFERRHGHRRTKEFLIKDLPTKQQRRFKDIRTGSTYVVELEEDNG